MFKRRRAIGREAVEPLLPLGVLAPFGGQQTLRLQPPQHGIESALVDIDDVGMACAFLAHDAARLMTGQVLYIDGGYNIID